MRRHTNRRATAAVVAVAAAVLGVAAAGTASATPSPRLPDANLVCGDTTMYQGDWTTVPGSDSLWILTGELAGHYSVLTATHYFTEGYLQAPPASYDGLEMVDTKSWGAKTGLTDILTCDFVSRWGADGAEGTFSIVGPVTMARVGR